MISKHKSVQMIMGLIALLMIATSLISPPMFTDTSQALKGKNVLLISSYSESFITVPMQLSGIQKVLTPLGVHLEVEYMDTKRFSSAENLENFYKSISYKIKNSPPYDALIVGDDAALQFALDHKDELFQDLPVVFYGINDRQRAIKAANDPLMTGLVEETSLKENIHIAELFNPKATEVVAIVDSTLTGQGDQKQFEAAMVEFPQLKGKILNVSQTTFESFATTLENLNDQSILLFLSMNQDQTERYLNLDQQIEYLREHTQVPVFRASVGGVGQGLLGGRMIDYEAFGKIAAEKVVQILQGTKISEMPLMENTPYHYIFDYKLIQKYQIDESNIPKGAVLINKEVSPLEKYKYLIGVVLAIIMVLLLIAIIVSADNLKLRKIQKELSESHEELTATYEELAASEEELQSQYDYIEHFAAHDFLTGLPNRLKFAEVLCGEIANNRTGALLLLDIDDFKNINDTQGHYYGDELLKEIAKRIAALELQGVFSARMGGDEFLVLLKGANGQADVEAHLAQIRDAVRTPFMIEGHESEVNFSIGITFYPEDGQDMKQLMINADTAMYKAKAQGKNSMYYYHTSLLSAAKTKRELETVLRHATANDGFCLHYQPQVDAISGEIVSYEALLRMKDSQISPGQFIPVAEETGQIIQIGRWVAQEAIRQISFWKSQGLGEVKVAINYSSKQIRDLDYVDYLRSLLDQYEVNASAVEIEITESILMENNFETMSFLESLKSHGFTVALDDFGTGFSSLNYLTYLPVDKIKLDKSINDKFLAHENPDVMRSLISLAHSLNLTVTAEGIEDLNCYKKLRDCGCNYIQGYLFSKPLTSQEVGVVFFKNPNGSIDKF